MATLGKAIEIAARVYVDRVYGDEASPYVLHSLAVMHHASAWGDSRRSIVAVLHAAVEERRVSIDELKNQGFSSDVIEALQILPRRDGESAVECARRVSVNEIASSVKLVNAAVHMNEDYAGGTMMDAATKLEYSEVKAILTSHGRRNAP